MSEKMFALELARKDKRIAELEAEIARLKPAAEAYHAQVRWENSKGGTVEDIKAAWIEYRRAADYATAVLRERP